MKNCRYFIPGLALSFVTGYALSLLVPIKLFKQMLSGVTGISEEIDSSEPPVQENDPYIEELVRELNADQFAVS